jgi:peptide subunit release factor 1 (eRF1)
MATTTSTRFRTSTLDVQTALEKLRTAAPGQGVLSVYLDTSPNRIVGQAYLLAYRAGVRSVRSHVPEAESETFEAAVAQVERFLVEEFAAQSRGIAVFVDALHHELTAVALPQAPVLEHIVWDKQPEISPLQTILDESERIAVVLFDSERARLFSVFLGAIEEQQRLEDYVPAKQATGGWFALQQTSFERHREDHLRRHAQNTVQALTGLLRAHAFDRLLIGGPDEALSVLRHELPRPLQARLAGTLDLELFASDASVVEATLHAAEAIEQQHEQRLIKELLDSATTPRVVLGLAGTLEALAEGRVHLLIVAKAFDETGAQCTTCGRLMRERHRCPECGIATQPVGSLHEAAVRQALAQGALVETVSAVAAARLIEHGGIGAWTRF